MSLFDLPKHIKRRLVKEYINPKLFEKNVEYLVKENYVKIIKGKKLDKYDKLILLKYVIQYQNKEIAELVIHEIHIFDNVGLFWVGFWKNGNQPKHYQIWVGTPELYQKYQKLKEITKKEIKFLFEI